MWRYVGAEQKRAAWDGLAAGLGPMEVSRLTGVSKSQVYRWHHSVGGVYRPPAFPVTRRVTWTGRSGTANGTAQQPKNA
jgi:hypothetical protein